MRFKFWIVLAVCLFGIGIVLGLTVKADFITQEVAAIKEMGGMLGPFRVSTAVFIFVKNVLTLLLSFVFSPILCLLPIFALMANGWLLSFVVAMAVQQRSLGFALTAILPHGIIEIPALIIGEAAALGFGALVILSLFKKEVRSQVLPGFKTYVKYLLLALALLIPAAFIEAFVTPLLIKGA